MSYAGPKVEKLIGTMKKVLKSKLLENIITKSAYSVIRLSDKFNIKNRTKKVHIHNVTYYVEWPEENGNEKYLGETGHRLLDTPH